MEKIIAEVEGVKIAQVRTGESQFFVEVVAGTCRFPLPTFEDPYGKSYFEYDRNGQLVTIHLLKEEDWWQAEPKRFTSTKTISLVTTDCSVLGITVQDEYTPTSREGRFGSTNMVQLERLTVSQIANHFETLDSRPTFLVCDGKGIVSLAPSLTDTFKVVE